MQLTFASFNIGAAAKRSRGYTAENLLSVAAAILASKADILCLQEVDLGCARSGGVDMPRYLCEHTHCPYLHFIPIRPFQGGLYGTLILSRFPFVQTDVHNYPVRIATQGTSAGMAEVNLGRDHRTLRIFNTHLSCENEDSNTETMECYNAYLMEKGQGSFVAAGDFNAFPDKVASIIRAGQIHNLNLPTYEAKAIDNIVTTADIEVADVHTVDTTLDGTSDHRLLLATLRLA